LNHIEWPTDGGGSCHCMRKQPEPSESQSNSDCQSAGVYCNGIV
jgi:hypothetical protein